MEIGSKIKEIRDQQGMSMEKLADELNKRFDLKINKSTVSRWEKGSDISGTNLYYLSTYFDKSPSYFYGIPEDTYLTSTNIEVPIVTSISCGNGKISFDEISGYEMTPKDWLNGGEYFYLYADGDSMTGARINNGDLVLMRKQDDVENGEIAAVVLNDQTYLKRVYKSDSTILLHSENSNYQPIIVKKSDDFRIVGKLKKVVINF